MITLSNLLMIIGIVLIVLSFFFKDRSKKIERDVEDLSINIYQETNALKRRLKIVEEELLLENPLPLQTRKAQPIGSQPQGLNRVTQAYAANPQPKPIHGILVSQVLELSKQGYSIPEIQKRSALSEDQIVHILQNGGQ